MNQLHHARFIPALFLIILGFAPVVAQEGIIRGRVVDESSGKGLEYAYILNYSLQKSIYCNSAGEFRLSARPGDTLVLYALGYFYQKVIVHPFVLESGKPADFPLRQQAYELTEARILGFGSYEDFRQKFIALEPPMTKTDYLNESLAETSRSVAVEAYEKAKAEGKFGGGIVTVPILTPEEKERIKLAGIIAREKIRDQIYQKYNPVVVKKVTGLTDDDDIINFMAFCDFSEKYLLNVSDYDLMARIAAKFELYMQNKEEDEQKENPLNFTHGAQDTIA